MLHDTPRLILRELTAADTPDIERIFSHPDFFYAQFMQNNTPVAEAAKNFINLVEMNHSTNPRTGWFMAIIKKEDKKFIGMRALDELKEHPEFGLEAESSVFIDVAEWNKGYSFEAAQAMKGFAKSLGIQSLYATADPRNTGSWRNLEKLGMQCMGLQEISKYTERDGSPAARLFYRVAL